MRDIFEIRAKKERKGYRFELFGVEGGGGWETAASKRKLES